MINIICNVCGGEDVLIEALVKWDKENQTWKPYRTVNIQTLIGFCNTCEDEQRLKKVSLEKDLKI